MDHLSLFRGLFEFVFPNSLIADRFDTLLSRDFFGIKYIVVLALHD